MEALYFTVAAIILYVIADTILNRIEIRLGHRLRHRSLIFFGIILFLSLVTFEILRRATSS
ncbi:MAG: hypothetical protein H3C38_17030 [Rhodospirillales bacterium]|nr:hypothetical protein [Rhodospirillales bacterium]